MRLYIQRVKGSYAIKSEKGIVARFFSHTDNHKTYYRLNKKMLFCKLPYENEYENMEIGDIKNYSEATELVRIA